MMCMTAADEEGGGGGGWMEVGVSAVVIICGTWITPGVMLAMVWSEGGRGRAW